MDWNLRPARDLGLTLGDRLRSHSREPGPLSLLVHRAWSLAAWSYLKLVHRLTIAGAENIPHAAPFILIANHTSHLDALSLLAALPRALSQRAYALAAGDVFFARLPGAGFAALALNALPIWRGRTTGTDLAFLRQRLAEDRMVFILFPEGTRSRTGAMGPFKPGIGALAAGSAVPVVPCHLQGAYAAWPPASRLPRPGRLHLTIGPPLSLADLPDDKSAWPAAAQRCEAAVRALAPTPPVPPYSATTPPP